MTDNIQPNADLAKILATLASLQQPQNTASHDQQQTYGLNQSYQGYGELPQVQPSQQSLPYHHSADPRLLHQHTPQPPKPQDRTSTPLIDPATIIEWKQGLRCVSKIATQNPDFAASVRKLMKEQEGNVKQWEAGRERVIEDHNLKRENEKAHRAALSLPGLLEGSPLLRTSEREQAELTQYDAKVYRACKAMTESQTSSLKVLGVPFFGVKPHLIMGEGDDSASTSDVQQSGGASSQKITRPQLMELQRKMLNHLMELYGD
ncbi:hypothetical protein EK21DRAFT_104439 [Setomelanomma holmii]|uniref:Uncharacterized protein n=1 Tax=Setomelanomma holmii TaxID=210430 RepID=A0A9P4GZD7_9PLEO|nr:hypothetical protein EK21DRAFT_104439 [Setomelanomma holmii]